MGAPRNDLQNLQSAAFEALPTPALLFGVDARLTAANEAAEQLFGQALGMLARASSATLGPNIGRLIDTAEFGGRAGGRDVDIAIAGMAICRADVVATVMPDGGLLLSLTPREPFDRAEASQGDSLGGLGRALAHEIKNPLAGIRGAAQLLREGARAEDVALADLIVDETERIRRLADRMEALAQEGPARREPVNIHRVLDRVAVLVAGEKGEGVLLRHDYDPSLPDALGDEDQLIQIFLNLVKNAVEAVRDRPDGRGDILISTAYRHQPRARLQSAEERPATPLEIRVRDNGHGVPRGMRDRLFQPFASGRTGGTGLGLALTSRLVAVHDGSIDFESEPGRTVFRVLLPVASSAEAAS